MKTDKEIAQHFVDLWMQGEVALGRKAQDESCLRDMIVAAIEQARERDFRFIRKMFKLDHAAK